MDFAFCLGIDAAYVTFSSSARVINVWGLHYGTYGTHQRKLTKVMLSLVEVMWDLLTERRAGSQRYTIAKQCFSDMYTEQGFANFFPEPQWLYPLFQIVFNPLWRKYGANFGKIWAEEIAAFLSSVAPDADAVQPYEDAVPPRKRPARQHGTRSIYLDFLVLFTRCAF